MLGMIQNGWSVEDIGKGTGIDQEKGDQRVPSARYDENQHHA